MTTRDFDAAWPGIQRELMIDRRYCPKWERKCKINCVAVCEKVRAYVKKDLSSIEDVRHLRNRAKWKFKLEAKSECRRRQETPTEAIEIVGGGIDVADEMERAQLRHCIERLRSDKVELYHVVHIRYFVGLSQKDAAVETGVNYWTLAHRLTKALEWLRTCMRGWN